MRLSSSIVSVVSISAALVASAATGCKKTPSDKAGDKAGSDQAGAKAGSDQAGAKPEAKGGNAIALLLPESQTTRYESADRPFFEVKFEELCPGVEIVYSNANQVATPGH